MRGRKRPRVQRVAQRRTRSSLMSVTFLLCLLLLSSTSRTTSALRILLTNDDGLDKPGLQTLRRRLIQDGHDVFVYATAADRSGISASVQLSVPFVPLEDQQTIVVGPPATCVIAGLSLMNTTTTTTTASSTADSTTTIATNFAVGPPDVVIVGISDGFATGAQTLHSSSVGAALTAMGRGFPTIVVAGLSTNPTIVVQEVYYAYVADFTARLLTQWVATIPLEDMAPGAGLKVTYPPLQPEDVIGVQLAKNGDDAPLSFGYTPSTADPTLWQVSPVMNEDEQVDPDSETALVDAGYVSILPITSSFVLPERQFNVRYILTLRRMLRGVDP
ncbi:nucleotidase SurE [Seminavis robusta]|uniref:Nucleotidase SurE n=1 Tax=Seminavis robusta TaxID=568900 RepID=A0A9N8HLQ4_9STRA|nr:nucleotidase SurE [Seminavis robusta]|eukprot:Sro830_g208210.1 nucleotidase SurE (331) ;mRNA; f:17880-18872